MLNAAHCVKDYFGLQTKKNETPAVAPHTARDVRNAPPLSDFMPAQSTEEQMAAEDKIMREAGYCK